MSEIAELHRLAGQAVAAVFDGPDVEIRRTAGGTFAFSGEPVTDLNMLVLASPSSPAVKRLLEESVARVEARGLPMLAMAPPDVAETLAPDAARLALDVAGSLPLMVLRGAPTRKPGPATCRIDAVSDADGARVVVPLVSAAFELPADAISRAFGGMFAPTSGAANFVAYADGAPQSSVTVTRTGATAGVWNMATPPERQGKGMGRALLTGVLEQLSADGVERFYLFATAAGRPLYESLGFETLADAVVWVKGAH
jgi:GNAT superfamily N-acetyltransferase